MSQPFSPTINSSFSKINPKLQTAWDSHSIGELKTCPRLYYYTIVCGYSNTEGTLNPHLRFGLLLHAGREKYEHLRADGLDHDQALVQTIRQTLLDTIDEFTNDSGETERRIWLSEEPTKTQKTLLRTLVLYLDKFQNDPMKTVILSDGRPAVEHSFSINLAQFSDEFVAPTGESYILCGHLDKLAIWNESYWIPDLKTTKFTLDERYFNSYTPDNQVSCYDVAGNIIFSVETEGVVIDAMQILVGGSRFMRRPIPRTPGTREEWLKDLSFYLRMNEEYVRLDYWPLNDKNCVRYGRRCQFAPICGADPSVRQDLLDAHFSKRRVWDPLQPR